METKTKELTFAPKINKSSSTKRVVQDIGNYLHSVQKLQEDKLKKKQEEQSCKSKVLASKKFVQNKSEKMLEKMEKDKLIGIFTVLDSDKDGLISASKIDITGLSIQLLDFLSPLFKDMEETSASLNEEAFVDAAYKKYKTSTVYDKKAVLDFNKKFRAKEELQQPTFTV